MFKVHRLCVSLNSRLESNNEEEGVHTRGGGPRAQSPVLGTACVRGRRGSCSLRGHADYACQPTIRGGTGCILQPCDCLRVNRKTI